MDKTDLSTHSERPIVQIGDTVHRPAHHWTPAVHELLNYLEKVGFKYSPRVLGFDDDGNEVLSFIEGESGKAGWYKILTDDGLIKIAKLLREYHEAVKYFRPKSSEWAYING